jgi:hypothetical protein
MSSRVPYPCRIDIALVSPEQANIMVDGQPWGIARLTGATWTVHSEDGWQVRRTVSTRALRATVAEMAYAQRKERSAPNYEVAARVTTPHGRDSVDLTVPGPHPEDVSGFDRARLLGDLKRLRLMPDWVPLLSVQPVLGDPDRFFAYGVLLDGDPRPPGTYAIPIAFVEIVRGEPS